jgi:hypothetical protein
MRIATVLSIAVVVLLGAVVVYRFYITGQLQPRLWNFFLLPSTWRFLGQGFLGTLSIAVCAGALSLALGLVLMLCRISHNVVLTWVARILIDFFRGVPSLLLIYFCFLVIPRYGIKLASFWMITLPVACAAAAVLAEVFRAGVHAVGKGQKEAARALGFSRWQVLKLVVLPQAIRYVIPALISQLVVVVKDTTVAYVVSYPDLMQNARVLITNYDALVSVYFVIAAIYILVNWGLNSVSVRYARGGRVSAAAAGGTGGAGTGSFAAGAAAGGVSGAAGTLGASLPADMPQTDMPPTIEMREL